MTSDRRIATLKAQLREVLDVLDAVELDPGSVLDVDDSGLAKRFQLARERGRWVAGSARSDGSIGRGAANGNE